MRTLLRTQLRQVEGVGLAGLFQLGHFDAAAPDVVHCRCELLFRLGRNAILKSGIGCPTAETVGKAEFVLPCPFPVSLRGIYHHLPQQRAVVVKDVAQDRFRRKARLVVISCDHVDARSFRR